MTRLGNDAEWQGSGREGDVGAQTHQRISLFEKCLYLRSQSRSLSPPLIACASSGLAMFTGKVGRVEEGQQEDRLQRRGERRARAAVFISRETPLAEVQSSLVCRRSVLRRRSVRPPRFPAAASPRAGGAS